MAMISGLDRAFGWLLAKLEERGLTENTIVVFTSDHGDTLFSYGWKNNKGRAENLSCRVPLLVRWPAKLQPGTSDLLVGTLDLMPTLLGLLGLPVPETCHGRDASEAVVAGRDDGVEAQPLFYLPQNWRGVYTRRYTYSEALGEADDDAPASREVFNALYDREHDPLETTNCFHDPAYADAKAALHATTYEFMERFGDPGIPYGELAALVLHEDDRAVARIPPAQRPRGWEARPIASPVEFLEARRALRGTRKAQP